MKNTPSQAFADSATAYAAFNLRSDYYWRSTNLLVRPVKHLLGVDKNKDLTIADLGAGIGISTMQIMKDLPWFKHMHAVEPENSMRRILSLNTMGDPRVKVYEGRAEAVGELALPPLDAVFACHMFHLLHPSKEESRIPDALKGIASKLKKGGFFVFDMLESCYMPSLPLVNHRSGKEPKAGEIMTELAHPLYQTIQRLALEEVKKEGLTVPGKSLWPQASSFITREYLHDECAKVGMDLSIKEELLSLTGREVLELVRNSWAVLFRWWPSEVLPIERKLFILEKALVKLHNDPHFEEMLSVTAYHFAAVCVATKR